LKRLSFAAQAETVGNRASFLDRICEAMERKLTAVRAEIERV